jgi:hypothetical protein
MAPCNFSTKPKFGASNADHLTDFNCYEDGFIEESKFSFGAATNPTLSLTTAGSPSELTAILVSTSTFIYDSSNGNRYWNQNGNKSGFGTGGIFAVLDSMAHSVFQYFVVQNSLIPDFFTISNCWHLLRKST